MKSSHKYFSAGLLVLLTQAAFAAAPDLGFAVLSAAVSPGGAVTCTDSSIIGDVGSSGLAASVVRTRCKIDGAVIAPVPAGVVTAFDTAYAALKDLACGTTLNVSTLPPELNSGVTCFPAGVTDTSDTLTLLGSSSDQWTIKIGTGGTGALTGTSLKVVLPAGASACNVTWWAAEAATMTDSDFKGTVLAGAAITITRGAFNGDALAKAAVTLTGTVLDGCEGGSGTATPAKLKCNQGLGNLAEGCDPGNSNQDGHSSNPFGGSNRTNDEQGGTPGTPGRIN